LAGQEPGENMTVRTTGTAAAASGGLDAGADTVPAGADRAAITLRTGKARALRGVVQVPGDKSISHRALMLGALAVGETRIEGLLEGEDVHATAAAMRAMGADIQRDAAGVWHVHGVGVGGLLEPADVLDMGNSGTSTRLIAGLLASHPLTAVLTGDASLRARPMRRVMTPLAAMGAVFTARSGDRLPLTVTGRCPALPISYRLPVASAQVKSAILLAGLNTPGVTTVIEPEPTRDHSERMLAGFGARLEIGDSAEGRVIRIHGEAELTPQPIVVPGDPSSAAFAVVAGLIVPGSDVIVRHVGINPTRAGLFAVLRAMGGDLVLENERVVGGEPVADIHVRGSALTGIETPPDIAPSMIDEYPVLAVACAVARGRSHLTGLAELRVKESDRLAGMAEGLAACGIRATPGADTLAIEGTGGDPVPGDATIATRLDHRIAMSFAVLGQHARQPVTVDDARPIATSYPDFVASLRSLGARLTPGPA